MLGGALCEVRSSHFDNDYRVFFCVHEGRMVLLHGAQKPVGKADTDLARTRKAEIDKDAAERRKEAAAKEASAAKAAKKKKRR